MSVRYLDRERTLAALGAAAAAIGAIHPEVREIRLFGSLARDERNPYADADLPIGLDRSDLAGRDRPPRYQPSGVPVPVDLLVCTQAELEGELAAANPFVKRIVAESLVLFRRPASRPAD